MELSVSWQRNCCSEINCTMDTKEVRKQTSLAPIENSANVSQKGEFDVVVAIRLIMGCLRYNYTS